MKSALRLAKRHGNAMYWLLTTTDDEVRLREHRMGKANKPSGRRKAFAQLVASVFMVGATGIKVTQVFDDGDTWSGDGSDPRRAKRTPRRPRITFPPRPGPPGQQSADLQALQDAVQSTITKNMPPKGERGSA